MNFKNITGFHLFPCLLSLQLCQHSLYENLLPTFVGPTLTVSDYPKEQNLASYDHMRKT